MKQPMFSNEKAYIPTYLQIEPIFDSLDSYGHEIKRPDIWEDDNELIVWGYRISASTTFFHSEIDYFPPLETFEYIHLCQYICNRMTDLLDCCITNIRDLNLKPKDFDFRIYHYCDYLSFEEEQELSYKLNKLVKSDKFKKGNGKGKLSDKVSLINEIKFSVGGGSRTLIWEVGKKKRSFVRNIERHELKTYQEYLNFYQQLNNQYNQLDELDI